MSERGIIPKPSLALFSPGNRLAAGLRAAWLFDEKGGAQVRDHMGRRIHGTISNAALNTAWTGGRWGKALELDGTNDDVDMPDNAGINFTNTQAWTCVTFFRWKSGSGTFPRIIQRNGDQSDLGVNAVGNILSVFSGASWRATSLAIDASKWYMITYQCDRTSNHVLRVFDGTRLILQENQAGACAFTGAITLGSNNAGAEQSNIIHSALLIYDRALSVSEIGALYTDAFLPVTFDDTQFLFDAAMASADGAAATAVGDFPVNSMKVREWTPRDLGLNGVNLKAANDTVYSSPIINVKNISNFLLSLLVDNTGGGAAGAVKLSAKLIADDGSTVLLTQDILTDISTLADRTEVVVFGRSGTAKKVGNGTLDANADIFRMAKKIQFLVTVVTQSDATTCTGSLRLLGQEEE